jgi:hypothetical protein
MTTKSKPGQRYLGKLGARVVNGLQRFRAHDGTKTWSDGGATETVLKSLETVEDSFTQATQQLAGHRQALAGDVRTLVANQVRDAVADYAQDSEWATCVTDGQLCIAMNLSNTEATLIVQTPLRELINAGVAEAWKAAATPAGQDYLAAVFALGRELTKLEGQARKAATAPPPTTAPPMPSRVPRDVRHEAAALA